MTVTYSMSTFLESFGNRNLSELSITKLVSNSCDNLCLNRKGKNTVISPFPTTQYQMNCSQSHSQPLINMLYSVRTLSISLSLLRVLEVLPNTLYCNPYPLSILTWLHPVPMSPKEETKAKETVRISNLYRTTR